MECAQLNDVMSAGLTSQLTGQHADQQQPLLRSFKATFFLLTCLTVILPVARAEKYIGNAFFDYIDPLIDIGE